jgi:hypothetical protein
MQFFGTVTSFSFSGVEGVKFDNKTIDYKLKFDNHKK